MEMNIVVDTSECDEQIVFRIVQSQRHCHLLSAGMLQSVLGALQNHLHGSEGLKGSNLHEK